MSEQDPAAAGLEMLNAGFRDYIPHNRELGFSIEQASWDPSFIVAKLPFDERLVAHPDSGLLHGGVITTLMDAAGGAAVYVKLGEPTPIATLDLRIDYLKPGGRFDVRSRAECLKITKNVAFVRMAAYHDDPEDPIALGTATYMIGTKGQAVAHGLIQP